jgi:Arc/MetJ family transcription regulator
MRFIDPESIHGDIGIMKTTVDIPDDELEDAMRFANARTKREAIVTAIREFNRRHRMAELVRYAGTCADLMTVEDLRRMRHQE